MAGSSCVPSRLRGWLFRCMVLTGLCGALHAGAEIKAPESGVPVPMPASIQVKRGASVEIPLRIYGSREEAARFRIRKLPQDGSLSAPKMTSRDEAVVTYKKFRA